MRSWLKTTCIDMIADALHEAEAALAKTVGQDARTAAVGAPAPEGARAETVIRVAGERLRSAAPAGKA